MFTVSSKIKFRLNQDKGKFGMFERTFRKVQNGRYNYNFFQSSPKRIKVFSYTCEFDMQIEFLNNQKWKFHLWRFSKFTSHIKFFLHMWNLCQDLTWKVISKTSIQVWVTSIIFLFSLAACWFHPTRKTFCSIILSFYRYDAVSWTSVIFNKTELAFHSWKLVRPYFCLDYMFPFVPLDLVTTNSITLCLTTFDRHNEIFCKNHQFLSLLLKAVIFLIFISSTISFSLYYCFQISFLLYVLFQNFFISFFCFSFLE